jgi:hypothetical protein
MIRQERANARKLATAVGGTTSLNGEPAKTPKEEVTK